MLPSLKPIDKTFLENPETALEHHPGFLAARKTAIIRPRDKAHLAFFHPTKELPHRIPKLPLKKLLPSFRQTLDEFPSRQPSIEKDSSGFTGNRQAKSQQILRTEGLRRLQHAVGYIGALVAREMKPSLLEISGEQPLTKDQETAGVPRKTTVKSFSPQNVLVENKFSRTSAVRGTEISVGQGEALSRLQRPLENIPSKPLQKQARRNQTATETELIPNVKPRQKETPLSFQPKPGGTATPSSTCGKTKLGKRGRVWRHLDRKTSFTRHSVRQRKRDEGKTSSITTHDRERPHKCSTERQKTAV